MSVCRRRDSHSVGHSTTDSLGQGLGADLVGVVEAEARCRGATAVHLWSDSRFTDAHRLYERLGYARLGETRALHDRSATVEYYFSKAITSPESDPIN